MIKKIGKGGFSTVYEVRNQLDQSIYAMKKIILKIKNKHNIQQEIETVLQEIRLLARIKSEHVVNYNHSWVEVKLKETKEKANFNIYNEDLSFEWNAIDENSDFIVFLESSNKQNDAQIEAIVNDEKKPLNNKISLNNIEYE